MELTKLQSDLLLMKSKSSLWRGTYITEYTFLEICMSEYISRYFTKIEEKRNDLMNLFLCEKVSFETKRVAFEYILKKKNPNILIEYPDMVKDIIELMNHRNIIAHYMLDSSESGISLFNKNELSFIKFSHKNNPNIVVSDARMKQLMDNLIKYNMMMVELLK